MTARDSRRCALQALYQFDAAGDEARDVVRGSLDDAGGDAAVHESGFRLAEAAWERRVEADAAVSALTPDWPTARQPVVDRSILRLAYHELVTGDAPPKVVINEAVELAREFSTEKSPLFVNAVLDKIYKRTLRDDPSETDPDAQADSEAETEIDAGSYPDAPDAPPETDAAPLPATGPPAAPPPACA